MSRAVRSQPPEASSVQMSGFRWAVKRAIDMVLTAALGLLLAPLWLAVAVAVKATSRGPVFYRQRRIGRYGREFHMLKFRSMVAGDHVATTPRNPDGTLAIIEDSDKVTPVGRFIRRWSIDELPQLINVLKGEMSLVGPRPDLVCQADACDDGSARRLLVRPGITGLAQVSGRSVIPFAERHRLDVEYVDRYSLWLDLRILAATAGAVLLAKGFYEEDTPGPQVVPSPR